MQFEASGFHPLQVGTQKGVWRSTSKVQVNTLLIHWRHRLAVDERLIAHYLDQDVTEAAFPDIALHAAGGQWQRHLVTVFQAQQLLCEQRRIHGVNLPLEPTPQAH